jgi:hypothetical protein
MTVTVLLAATALGAQSRARIRVAVVDQLSTPNARAEVLRFGLPGQPDIILLTSTGATAQDLAVALAAYRSLRLRAPASGGRIGRTTITEHDAAIRMSPAVLGRAGEMLRRVRAAGESRIGNLGRGRWEEFDVSP